MNKTRALGVLVLLLGALAVVLLMENRGPGPLEPSESGAEGERSTAGGNAGDDPSNGGRLRGHGPEGVTSTPSTGPDTDLSSDGGSTTARGDPADPTGSAAGTDTVSDEVRKFLEGWAESAGHVRVGKHGPALGLPRRIRRLADGGHMVLVPAAQFAMGVSASGQTDEVGDVTPTVTVRITRAFYIDETEVTVAQWKRYVAATKAQHALQGELGDDAHPVVGVPYEAAAAFAAWARLELPTEAQWELAARGQPQAITMVFPHSCEGTPDAARCRHWTGRYEDGPARVARFLSNRIGLFDVGGNAAEWCRDAYVSDFYKRDLGWPREDPLCGPPDAAAAAAVHVVRGGSWFGLRQEMRVFHRSHQGADVRGVGFRCARVTPFEYDTLLPGGSERYGPPERPSR